MLFLQLSPIQAHLLEQHFISSFIEIQQALESERRELERTKAGWRIIRSTLKQADAGALDSQFKTEFEKLENRVFQSTENSLQAVWQSLYELVWKGASAQLLHNDELDSYNLAMLIKNVEFISSPEVLDMITKIVRLTIIAGADLYAQKAYVGQGGSISLELVILGLATGPDKDGYRLRNMEQYTCYYNIFPWIVDDEKATAGKGIDFDPLALFMLTVRKMPEVASFQEKTILRLMSLGFPPFGTHEFYSPATYFSHVAAMDVQWLALLFPFEDAVVKPYLEALQKHLDAAIIRKLLNGFTSNNKARKHFKAYFSARPHWLLQSMIELSPEEVFNLVKRNEQDMLIPFLKYCKRSMAAWRDDSGRTLLQQAAATRGVVENTLQLLRDANL